MLQALCVMMNNVQTYKYFISSFQVRDPDNHEKLHKIMRPTREVVENSMRPDAVETHCSCVLEDV